jgi:hypothetical protein
MTFRRREMAFAGLSVALVGFAGAARARTSESRLENRELRSASFSGSKIGVDPVRKMVVYLPAGYDEGARRYPVIYYLANGPDSYRGLFDGSDAKRLFDKAIASGVIGPFILVSADMNTKLGSSWFVNSSATGNWEDFLVKELAPYMDANFRTLPSRESRALLGDRMGGYGAIRIGMRHPEVFSVVYALHPVGAGNGLQIMFSRPNWDLLANAKSLDDLKGDLFAIIFTSIFQAHLPNPDKPPLFTDLPARKVGDRLVIDQALTERLQDSFFLERLIPKYADNLKSLRGFRFDWGRNDTNQDHVYSNEAFTHKLDEYGVPYEAEEYRGFFGERNWGDDGRVYTEALPFFGRRLVFDGRVGAGGR